MNNINQVKKAHLALQMKIQKDSKGVLSYLKEATLIDRDKIVSSKNKAYHHPSHTEEALIQFKNEWFVYDLCGDFTSYRSLEDALLDFISPIGDLMYRDMVKVGQNTASNIFN